MNKFTPGPWIVERDSQGKIDIVNFSGRPLLKMSNWEANAKLIAMAPDMYEALNLCLDEMVRHDFATLSIVPKIKAIIAKIQENV